MKHGSGGIDSDRLGPLCQTTGPPVVAKDLCFTMNLITLDQFGARIPVTMQNITAKPKDMSEMSGLRSEKRTLDKLIDGFNNTTDEQHMWLIPYQQGLH